MNGFGSESDVHPSEGMAPTIDYRLHGPVCLEEGMNLTHR